MSAKFRIQGQDGSGVADIHQHDGQQAGLVVYDTPLDHFRYNVQYLTNGEFGRDMNVDPTAGTVTTTIIHDGGDTAAWTAAAVTGGGFNFTSTANPQTGLASIDATVSANNDIADFTAPSPFNPTNFVSFRAGIYLSGFEQSGTKDILFQWYLNGTPVGVQLSVKRYIDTTSLNNWQLMDVPMGDFQIQSPTVNELRITTVDSGRGAPPDYYLDNMLLVSTAAGTGVAEFEWRPQYGHKFYLNTLRMSALTSGKTDLDSTEFFGIPALTNGIELVLRDKDTVFYALDARDIFDIISWGDVYVKVEGSNNNVTQILDFQIPERHLMVDGSKGQYIVLRVRDNLSSLTRLRTSLNLSEIEEHH